MNRFLALLFLAGYCLARPATFDEYLAIEDDIASVGSMRRDVRAPAPAGFATEVADLLSAGTEIKRSRHPREDKEPKKTSMKNTSGQSKEGGYYKTYGSDAEGEKGYLKQSYAKGDKGYKTLDTFHKQNGDNYGFEKHTAFGKGQGAEASGDHGNSGSESSHEHVAQEPEGAGTIVEEHYESVEGDGGDGESQHYTEGAGDSGHYTEGGDSGHYTDDGEGGHYTSGGEGSSGSYSSGGGGSEHYSTGGGDEGSYGTHGSYSHGGDSGDSHNYDSGYEGGHF